MDMAIWNLLELLFTEEWTVFQENVLLKATNTNNNPKMAAPYYMN